MSTLRSRMLPLLAAALLALATLAVAQRPADAALHPAKVRLGLARRITGLSAPTGIANAGDGTARLFVAELAGRVRLISRAGRLAAAPYLDITDRVTPNGERGLLSVAFHPRFETNRYLYVAYTRDDGSLRVSRFTAPGPGASRVAASTELRIIQIAHPGYTNHNGGQLAFGPDGYLYIGTGDGGGGGDPGGNAQDRTSLLGKVLRIDVDHNSGLGNYDIPDSNPYRSSSSIRKEIFHFGLRNPWRFSFDRAYPNLWLGDVGQSAREEINRVPIANKGQNFGWDCREANLDVSGTYGGSYCAGRHFTRPLAAYRTGVADRCSVIGGYVYRGRTYKSIMGGMYVYGDFCSGELFGITHLGDNRYVSAKTGDSSVQLTAFGETESGELYATGLSGGLYRVTAARR
jgi:glucose/arabinose dehydrogenase